MTPLPYSKGRNKILFINSFTPEQAGALDKCSQILGRTIMPILLFDTKKIEKDWLKDVKNLVLLRVDFDDREAIQNVLKPYTDEILTATALGDSNIPYLKKVIPFFAPLRIAAREIARMDYR